MENDLLIEKIKKCERNFPTLFATKIEKEYGILFYNLENKLSHDSNHAILFSEKINNLDIVIKEIKSFYLEKNIVPRIYQPFIENYFMDNKEILEKNGYLIEDYGINKYMILEADSEIDYTSKLTCRLLSEWDKDIEETIFIPLKEEYEIPVAKSYLKDKNCYLCVGYYQNIPAIISYMHTENKITRLDYILVAKEFRRMGFAKELLMYMIHITKEKGLDLFYQWPADEIAEGLYYKAGFRTLFEVQACAAVYEQYSGRN